ncbi:hypothetical protein CJ030_MR7G016721 [Morella rubra]|uniref:Endonuclease/exonuclease/phosphatase domain-containing protein n=1 Tax=Morella rubra TaxID=262757 RepID=A0A6A1UZK3_9ROSI|nr:hypothetical protein CJ030_MR7G016721 [Morella rubra]
MDLGLGFNGNPFTWNNGRRGCANIRERLDRGLVNQQWRVQYPNASILHSSALASDHLPLILNTDGHGHLLSRPFRFEAMWVRDPGSFFTIAAVWCIWVAGRPAIILAKKNEKVKKALRI